MRQIKEEYPSTLVRLGSRDSLSDLYGGVLAVIDIVRRIKADYTEAINYNAVTEVTQAAQPTPESGRMVVWNDSDAASGQPTHYLVYNFSGTVVTFPSNEVTP